MRVAIWATRGEVWSPECIVENYPHLTLAGVHAALAYYYANRAEIDVEIAEEDAAWEQAERELALRR